MTTITNEEILQEIEQRNNKKTPLLTTLSVFIGSVFLFIATGLFASDLNQLIIISIVLFVHEGGHWVAMRVLGYSDVKMFFIPFFGAATSGQDKSPSGTKDACVTLAGPLPGIFIGILLGFIYSAYQKDIILDFAVCFLLLNVFNLVPIYPFDGGRFLNTVLFSRNFNFEILFKITTSILLLLLAIFFRMPILYAIPVLILLSLKRSRLISKAATSIKEYLPKEQLASLKLDVETIKMIREKLDARAFTFHGQVILKYISVAINEVWKNINIVPPNVVTTITVMVLYCMAFFFGLMDCGKLMALQSKHYTRYELSKQVDKNNNQVNVELKYYKNKLIQKSELDEAFQYNGKREMYSRKGALEWTGYFTHGLVDGQWVNNKTGDIIVFDKGRCVSKRQYKYGVFKDISWGVFSVHEKKSMERWINKQGSWSPLEQQLLKTK